MLPVRGTDAGAAPELPPPAGPTETDATAWLTEVRAGPRGRDFIARVGDEERAERVEGVSVEDDVDVGGGT